MATPRRGRRARPRRRRTPATPGADVRTQIGNVFASGVDDLVVIADLPRVDHPSTVLGEALDGLRPLLGRADQRGGDGADARSDGPAGAADG